MKRQVSDTAGVVCVIKREMRTRTERKDASIKIQDPAMQILFVATLADYASLIYM